MTGRPAVLSDLQVEVAGIFFGLAEAKDYLVAGGAALLASRLIIRPTEDLDLFAAAPTETVTDARHAFVAAAGRRGLDVQAVHDSPTFCRFVVARSGAATLVDLAIDSPPVEPPISTVLGPTLAPTELAGRKLLALFGRAEARDFADVYLLVRRFGRELLLAQAALLDRGFSPGVLSQMLRSMSRFDDDEVPLPAADLADAREFFAAWTGELADGAQR